MTRPKLKKPTVSGFRRWLESLPPRKRVGTDEDCPLVLYVAETNRADPAEVTVTDAFAYLSGAPRQPLGDTLGRFVEAIDKTDWDRVTASRALKVLTEVGG